MFESRRAERALTAGFVRAINSCPKARNQPWAHTSLRRGLGMRTTAFTSAAAKSFITVPSYIPSTGDRWKRFLSLVSLADTLSGFELTRASASTARK